jgi:hypothetical protein
MKESKKCPKILPLKIGKTIRLKNNSLQFISSFERFDRKPFENKPDHDFKGLSKYSYTYQFNQLGQTGKKLILRQKKTITESNIPKQS